MGPNSKKAQQANAAKSNGPARARFSTWVSPSLRKPARGRGGGRGGSGGRGGGRGGAQAAAKGARGGGRGGRGRGGPTLAPSRDSRTNTSAAKPGAGSQDGQLLVDGTVTLTRNELALLEGIFSRNYCSAAVEDVSIRMTNGMSMSASAPTPVSNTNPKSGNGINIIKQPTSSVGANMLGPKKLAALARAEEAKQASLAEEKRQSEQRESQRLAILGGGASIAVQNPIRQSAAGRKNQGGKNERGKEMNSGGASKLKKQEWNCSQCTFLNRFGANSCEMCGTKSSGDFGAGVGNKATIRGQQGNTPNAGAPNPAARQTSNNTNIRNANGRTQHNGPKKHVSTQAKLTSTGPKPAATITTTTTTTKRIVSASQGLSNQEQQLGESLRLQHEKKMTTGAYKTMLKQRSGLPAYQMRETIVKTVAENQVVIVSGATGCGKTTQAPQLVWDSLLAKGEGARVNMICTQPRRISAIGVSDRISAERCEQVGGSVGYSIRLESRTSRQTRLLLCTTGILLRRLQSDDLLEDISHLFVDEIHERDLNTDFLLIVLKSLLKRNKRIRVVLMSATLNAKLFSDYFGGAPVVDIPGRAFPVKPIYLESVLQLTNYELPKNDKDLCFVPPKKSGGGGGRGKNAKPQATGGKPAATAAAGLLPDEEPPAKENLSNLAELKQWYPSLKPRALEALKGMAHDKLNVDLLIMLLGKVCGVGGNSSVVGHSSAAGAGGGKGNNNNNNKSNNNNNDSSSSKGNAKGTSQPNGSVEDDGGAVLVFLSGMKEIETLQKAMQADQKFGFADQNRFLVLPLHSSLDTSSQRQVFKRPPKGVRKIVIATNIAETSITIDDVTVVVDAGRVKENRYDTVRKMATLAETWVSCASAKQREGRAGRVKPGRCYKLFTSRRNLDEYTLPEMLRVPLESLVLTIKALNLGSARSFLASAVNPPLDSSVDHALNVLDNLQAIDKVGDDEELTALGFHLSALPLDPRLGKMVIFGFLFKCLDPMLTIAAGLSQGGNLFSAPLEKRDLADKAKREICGSAQSDHLLILRAFQGWMDARRDKCERAFVHENFLSFQCLQGIAASRTQFRGLLRGIGFHPTATSNANADNDSLVRAILCAALYPHVVVVQKDMKKNQVKLMGKHGAVDVHPSSVNWGELDAQRLGRAGVTVATYFEKVKTSKVFLRDSTLLASLPLLVFGGHLTYDSSGKNMVLDNWLRFKTDGKTASSLLDLRKEIQLLLLAKIENETPSQDDAHSNHVITAIATLLDR